MIFNDETNIIILTMWASYVKINTSKDISAEIYILFLRLFLITTCFKGFKFEKEKNRLPGGVS